MDGFYRDWDDASSANTDGHGAADPAEGSQRKRQRDSLLLTAQLKIVVETAASPEPVDVRIRNLSAGGLMAEYPHRVSVGTPVALNLRGIGPVTGKVAWCAEGRLGIALDAQIDPQRARKPFGGGTQTPFYAKALPRR